MPAATTTTTTTVSADASQTGDPVVVIAADESHRGVLPWTVERRWFFQFFVGILMCVNNGACFCFGLFSPYMKMGGFQYTQSQINLVSTVGVLLSYFSLPTGFLYDHKGPQATLLVGTILNASGWFGLYFVFKDLEAPVLSNSVLVMCFFYGLSQLSASFFETGSVLTNLKCFSCYRGRVVLIQKTFMGLGGSIIAQIYIAFFEKTFHSIGPFFIFLFVYSVVAGAFSYAYVRLPTPATRCLGLNVVDDATRARGGGEPDLFLRPFNVGTGILVCSVFCIMAITLVENFSTVSTAARVLIGVLMIFLVVSFTSMAIVTPSYPENVGGYHGEMLRYLASSDSDVDVAEDEERKKAVLWEADQVTIARGEPAEGTRHTEDGFDLSTSETSITELAKVAKERAVSSFSAAPTDRGAPVHAYGTVLTPSSAVAPASVPSTRTQPPSVKLNHHSLWVNLQHREVWLMWYVCLAVWGAMTVVSSNSSQIYQALAIDGFSLTVNTVFVSIYGVASAIGRILVGVAQPIMERRRIPVTTFFWVAPVLNVIGLPLFLVLPAAALFVPFFVVGLATGVSWGSTVLIVTALFTSHNCGKHYSWLYTAGMLSPLLFNMALFAPVYDHYSAVQGRVEDHTCSGVVCLWVPLVVCTVVNAFAFPAALYFSRRTTARGGIVVSQN